MMKTAMRNGCALGVMFHAFLATASAENRKPEGYSLRHDVVIDAPVADVWDAFTTKDGLESWMAPKVEIDLRVGGTLRSVMKADAEIGGDATIESTILSLEPLRMISLRPMKAPGNFPFPNAMKKSWSVVYFDALGERRTKLTMIGLGYTDEPESMEMRDYFDKGNVMILDKLRAKFPKSAASGGGEEALRTLNKLVGGEWTHESANPDGTLFRSRSVIEKGPDGKSLVGRGWLGDGEGMFYHGATQMWLEPGGGELRFQNIGDDGGVARGGINPSGKDHVRWDWNSHAPSGKQSRYLIDMTFDDNDHYTFVLSELVDGVTPTERVRAKYARVTQTPEAFKKPKAKKP